MEIQACQRCGSTELRAPSVGDGSLPGLADVQWFVVCKRCGLRDVPLTFDDIGALKEHQAALAGWEDAVPEGPQGKASGQDDAVTGLAATATHVTPDASAGGREAGPQRSRFAAGFVTVVGAVVLALALGYLALMPLLLGTGRPGVTTFLAALVQAGVGLAFILVGRRMWARPA